MFLDEGLDRDELENRVVSLAEGTPEELLMRPLASRATSRKNSKRTKGTETRSRILDLDPGLDLQSLLDLLSQLREDCFLALQSHS